MGQSVLSGPSPSHAETATLNNLFSMLQGHIFQQKHIFKDWQDEAKIEKAFDKLVAALNADRRKRGWCVICECTD